MPTGVYKHKPCLESTKRKIGEANKGRKRPDMLGNTHCLGKKLTQEHKDKISKAMKGKTPKNWEQVRLRKGHHANKGCKFSEETKRKIGLSKMGEKNPAWKGGITPYATSLRDSRRYTQWRTSVYERDNYTCQDCDGDTSGNLNAHHIIPFAECLDLDYEDMIFNINNGLTYCEECHKGYKE